MPELIQNLVERIEPLEKRVRSLTFIHSIDTENFMMDNRNDVVYVFSAEGHEAIINSHIQGIVAYSTSPIISFTKTPVPMNFSQ